MPWEEETIDLGRGIENDSKGEDEKSLWRWQGWGIGVNKDLLFNFFTYLTRACQA